MEEVGPLPERAPVGHGARGLQRQRRRVELLHARPGEVARVPLGRGRSRQASATTTRCCASRSRCGTASDPILKERAFGLANSEGNHGEDVKEYYFYLDSTPTHSYMKYLYKYPQAAYPYGDLVTTNRSRGKHEAEYELLDTGVFDDNRYFDVFVEYAKAAPDDVLIRISVCNRGPEAAPLHVLPTLWFRNTWSRAGGGPKPSLSRVDARRPCGGSRAHHSRSAVPGIAGGLLPVLRRRRAAAVHRERDQQRAALRLGQRLTLREGRHRQLPRARRNGRGESGAGGDEGRGALPGVPSAPARRRSSGCG